jgi:hypothetical protein
MPDSSYAETSIAYAMSVAAVTYAVSVAAVAYPISVTVVSVTVMSVPKMPPVTDVWCSISVAVANGRRVAVGNGRSVAITVNRLFIVAVGIRVAATITIAAPIVRSGNSCTDERTGGKP